MIETINEADSDPARLKKISLFSTQLVGKGLKVIVGDIFGDNLSTFWLQLKYVPCIMNIYNI